MIIVLCVGIIASVFGVELLLKNHIEQREFPEREKEKLWGDRLFLRRYHNRGMAFGIGADRSPAVIILSSMMTAAAAMALVFSFGQRGNRWLQVGLSLLLGGAFSNTYDRLKRKYVVDYISFGGRWNPFRNLVFNISDFCILTGALLATFGAAQ